MLEFVWNFVQAVALTSCILIVVVAVLFAIVLSVQAEDAFSDPDWMTFEDNETEEEEL